MVLIMLFTCFVIYQINKALVRLEFKQEALCYDIYVLDKDVQREEQALLSSSY